MSTLDALNGIIVAAENYADDTQLHAAVRIHTAGLDTAALVDLISGLTGFIAEALPDLPRDTAAYTAEDLTRARREAVALAGSVLHSGERFTQQLGDIRSDPRLLSAAAAQLLAYTAQCIPGLTATQVLDAANAAISDRAAR